VWRTLYGLRDKTLQVIVSGASSKDDKLIALTFDDGPTPAYTPQVLATLAQHRIKATFFMIGQQVQAHPDIVRQVAQAGHAIGNHTYSHARLAGLGLRGVLDEVRRCQRALREHAHINPNLLRPPFGLRDVTAHIAIRALGFHIVNWSNSAEDWRGDNAATLAERVTRAAQPGHIILMHDGCGASDNVEVNPDRTPTVLALPMIVSQLHEQGYRFVTLPQLFAAAAPKREAWF
jgi:peptidoglycan/xylan/chitin deacetylase (PgdA/CDA1 family)